MVLLFDFLFTRSTLFLLVLDAVAALCSTPSPSYSLPTCEHCVPDELVHAPAIGFHLSHTYTTAAVRYHNGSIADVVQNDASVPYVMLMRRLAQEYPPEKTFWSRLRRRSNKLLGRPATPDVGVLSTEITALREATRLLRFDPTSVTLVTPNLKGLTDEDVRDAMEYAGLESLARKVRRNVEFKEDAALFAANDLGLCKNYTQPDVCLLEEDEMPLHMLLSIDFSRHVLGISDTILQTVCHAYSELSDYNPKLGLDSMAYYPDNATYWNTVGENLQYFVDEWLRSGYDDDFTKVLLLSGDSVQEPVFQDVLEDVLRGKERGRKITMQQHGFTRLRPSPLFAPARGAAEMGKRLQEAPRECVEEEDYRANRPALSFVVQ